MDFHFIPAFAISLNEDLLFFLVFGIFALIKFLSARKKSAEEAAPDTQSDAEKARRVREIQEEIRRRIAETQHRAAPPAEPQPASVNRPAVLRQEQVAKPSAVRRNVEVDLQAAQRTSRLYEQLEQARQMEAETSRKAAAVRAGHVARLAANQSAGQGGMVERLLHSPSGIKDAVILSEILSAPVSERRDASCPGLR
jgi:type IV secretory pathway VirB10-like protein